MASTESGLWERFREQMPVTRQWAYFDHAAVAPLSGPARDAVISWADDFAAHGDVYWDRWRRRVEEVRDLAAQLLHADRAEIAFIHSTTEGVNLVAEGYPWKPGDNVVVFEGEFPTNLYPWMALADRGVEVRVVPTDRERVDPAEVASRCDDRTGVVAVSWVGYATGWRNDLATLAEIAHRHGALLFVDAIQGLGALPLDVSATPIDALAADGHKWLLGPEGTGLFWLRGEHLDRLRPVGIGWNSVVHAGDFANPELKLRRSAQRYEGGSHAIVGIAALGASLRLLLETGVEAIGERILALTDCIADEFARRGARLVSCRQPGRGSGILAFELPGRDPQTVRRSCRDRGVVVNCRRGWLRISPHAYVNEEDIERLVEAVFASPK